MSLLSRDKARQFVDGIRARKGAISDEDRAETRAMVLTALENVTTELGASVQSIADEVFADDTRFVFELVQNAEDNKYTKAAAAHQEPYISFDLYPDRIIVDSNEDGFTEAQVEAICSTNKSSKRGLGGFIGKKGIGFKSVFKVAKKVHIQSGPFSFSFEYRRGGNGLGMVTPINEPFQDIPPDVGTRITLTMEDPSEFQRRNEDFREISDNLILFLTTLRKISINVNSDHDAIINRSHTKQREEVEGNRSVVRLIHTRTFQPEEVKTFYLQKSQVSRLADERGAFASSSEIVLGFPLDADAAPIIEQQDVFAYLPLCDAGFTFLIQADFVTAGSRQDVRQAQRNEELLQYIAKAFCDVMQEFSRSSSSPPSLQYQWIKYIPEPSVAEGSGYWSRLAREIIKVLGDRPVLRSQSTDEFYRPSRLRRVPNSCTDRYGCPLFADIPTDQIYLSPKYDWGFVVSHLKQVGVQIISLGDLLPRVRRHVLSTHPKLLTCPEDIRWQTKVAKLFARFIDTSLRYDFMLLPTIPLDTGTLASPISNTIYLPSARGFNLPTDLGLKLVSPAALENQFRATLFSSLGVSACDPTVVRQRIIARYSTPNSVTLQDSVQHLRYLFLEHGYFQQIKKENELDRLVPVFDKNAVPVYRTRVTHGGNSTIDDVYFESEKPYDTQKLFESIRRVGGGSQSGDTEPSVHFISPAYMNAVSAESRSDGLSWINWLESFAQVRYFPRLRSRSNPRALSDHFLHVINHLPDQLLATLKTHWSEYRSHINSDIQPVLAGALVPCDGMAAKPLRQTYLPLPDLMQRTQDLGIVGRLPFLVLPQDSGGSLLPGWSFLKQFGVGIEQNRRFYFHVLSETAAKYPHGPGSVDHFEKLCDVYRTIERDARADDYQSIRNYFSTNAVIPAPKIPDAPGTLHAPQWSRSENCVWDSNIEALLSKAALSRESKFRNDESLRRFFSVILAIGSAQWEDYLKHLQLAQRHFPRPSQSLDIKATYTSLWRHRLPMSSLNSMRETFENEQLIWLPSLEEWRSISSCLWTDHTRIPGRAALSAEYPSLEAFFTEQLCVRKPDTGLYVEELRRMTTAGRLDSSSIDRVKEVILEISNCSPQEREVAELQALRFLPIKKPDGRVLLESCDTDFAIVDRKDFGAAFASRISTLDFSLEQVWTLSSFLRGLGLQDRYMSHAVTQDSQVDGGEYDFNTTTDFRAKASPLFRCAKHFRSFRVENDDRSLHDVFSRTTVYNSNGISNVLRIQQDGRTISTESGRAIVHIHEVDNQLEIYLPRDETARELSYMDQFPDALMKHLGISDPSAHIVFQNVLEKRKSLLDVFLEGRGIVEIPDLPLPSHEPPRSSTGLLTPATTPRRPSDVSSTEARSSPVPVQAGAARARSANESGIRATRPVSASPSPSPRGSASVHGRFTQEPEQISLEDPEERNLPQANSDYRALLDRVILLARQAEFPNYGDPVLELTNASTIQGAPFGVRSENQMRHDVKLGAAGELYVFELLSNLRLPGFNRSNWKSTIRKEVTVHESYRDMAPWLGSETADFVYDDVLGKLTELLIMKGYIEERTWQHRRPRYYLEVKSTVTACDTRFYMSKAQYARMQSMYELADDDHSPNVYIILRVYRLGNQTAMRVYVNPEKLRRQGRLSFEPDEYSVLPSLEANSR